MKKALIVLVALLCLAGITNAQGKFGVSVQGALSLPMGDFGDACKTGFGGLGTFTYTLNKNLDIVATAGYLTYDYKNISGATFSTIPILGGVRYYFAAKNFKPYVTGELGVYSSKAKMKTVIWGVTFESESTSTDFGFTAGGGFLYQMGKNLDLDVTATFNSISTSGSSSSFINVLAGVHFAF